jgi:hypothetical protein
MCSQTKIFSLILLFLLISANDSSSQITSSPYSMFGLGTVEGNNLGAASGMGGTGIAFLSRHSLNLLNPASTAGLDSLFSIFDIGFSGQYTKFKSSNLTQSLFDANFKYVAMGFRVAPKWAVSFGITPYSSIGYKINTTADLGGSSQTFNTTFSGEGGVNQVFLGSSYQLTQKLSFGIKAAYLFGSVTHKESSNDYYYSLENVTYLSNFDMKYGLNYQFGKGSWKYNIGLIYDNGKKLMTDNVQTIVTASKTETIESTTNKFSIPRSAGIGFAIERDYFRAGFDYESGQWKNIEFDNPLLNTRNSNRYSMGIEVPSLGIKRDGSKMIFYRVGAEYCGSYLIIDGHPINYRSVSLGAGLPFHGLLSVINLSVKLGQNGTVGGGLFRETFCTFHVDISLKDVWFMKRKFF